MLCNPISRLKRKPRYRLSKLLAGISPDNLHSETEWGPAPGKEIRESVLRELRLPVREQPVKELLVIQGERTAVRELGNRHLMP